MDTREQWLNAAVEKVEPIFEEAGFKLPKVHVSCGWPAVGGTRRKQQRIGECWATEAAEDGTNHIFISPVLDEAFDLHTRKGVLETLVHELCHAVDDCESKHGAGFRKIATSVGLTGKMASTYASDELADRLVEIAVELGPYPHSRINLEHREKQSTRMLKLTCPCCGYLVRTSRKWIDMGLPSCPFGTEMELEEEAA